MAALGGHEAIFSTLLTHIPEAHRLALIQQRNDDGNSTLHAAARRGRVKMVNTILNHKEVDKLTLIQQLALIHQRNNQGKTALDIAKNNRGYGRGYRTIIKIFSNLELERIKIMSIHGHPTPFYYNERNL